MYWVQRVVGFVLVFIFTFVNTRQYVQPQASPVHSKALRSRQIGTETQILNRLFGPGTDYDANTRPPVRDYADHSAIVVITSIYVNRITWHRDSADVDLYLREQWQDSRLIYEVDPREGINEITFPSNRKIWTPDTFFVGVDEHSRSLSSLTTRTVIEPNGYVRYREKRSLTLPIETENFFPFSTQKRINFKLSSYNYPIEDIVYLWANSPPTVLPVEVSPELLDENAEFSFLDASAGDCLGNYSVGVYSCINVSITFKGSSLMRGFFKVFIPSILLVVASWLHFWIHGSWSVPRSFSAAIPFFIFVVASLFWNTHSKAIHVWLLGCVFFTFLSLLEYFLVICCGMRRRVLHPAPTTTTISHVGQPQKDLYQQNTPHHHQQLGAASTDILITKETIVETEANKANSNFGLKNDLDFISRIAFPVAFFIFLIIYIFCFSI